MSSVTYDIDIFKRNLVTKNVLLGLFKASMNLWIKMYSKDNKLYLTLLPVFTVE